MKIIPLVVAAGLLFAQPLPAEYRQPFAVEIHTGPVAPSDDITSVDLDAGIAFGATVSYYFPDKRFGIYTGFDVDAFDAESTLDNEVTAAILYGYSLGVEYRAVILNSDWGFFARAGTHLSKFQLIDNDDDDVRETKFDAGFETSAGLTYDLRHSWALRGGLRYKTFSRRFKNLAGSDPAEVDSTTLLLGARFDF